MKAGEKIGAVRGITKKWAKQRKREERDAAAAINRRYVMTRRRSVCVRNAAFASMNERPEGQRQWPPACARRADHLTQHGLISNNTPTKSSAIGSISTSRNSCCSVHRDVGVIWNVVYDARGNFTEPHTKIKVPLGTLPVRGYLARIRQHKVQEPQFDIWEELLPDLQDEHRFGAILLF